MTDGPDDDNLVEFDPNRVTALIDVDAADHSVQLDEQEAFERGADNLVDLGLRPTTRPLPDISQASAGVKWLGKEPAPLAFAIADFCPSGMTTLLVGAGGSGKSILMQSAITCVVNDLPAICISNQRSMPSPAAKPST